MTGHPAPSLNCGWTPAGLPVGIHLVARLHEEALLRAAAALERINPMAAWRLPAAWQKQASVQGVAVHG